jgi:succinyl-CoA synthetase beta subunit
MKIHEYQAKQLFRKYDIPVPLGMVAFSPEEAMNVSVGSCPFVLKAQIHAGGRGKAGGVKLADNRNDVSLLAKELLSMHLVTPQTGPEGKAVNKILVEERLSISQELYLSLLIDRCTAKIVIMASTSGGMDIEEVAQRTPEKIVKVFIDPLLGIQGYHCRSLGFGLGLESEVRSQFTPLLSRLYKLFVDYDCSLLEINPLAITAERKLVVLDAKVDVDNNALFRQPEIQSFRDPEEEDPSELQASEYHLNYIKLDGTIGNMVNGAGLAMATMDLIKKAGAAPANFLDVGGGATAQMVENGFRIILSDKNVKAILVNIFGGILRCDILAQGIVEAAKKCNLDLPVIVRLEGTNAEEGRKILLQSGLSLITADNLKEACKKIASVAKEQIRR